MSTKDLKGEWEKLFKQIDFKELLTKTIEEMEDDRFRYGDLYIPLEEKKKKKR